MFVEQFRGASINSENYLENPKVNRFVLYIVNIEQYNLKIILILHLQLYLTIWMGQILKNLSKSLFIVQSA